MKMAVTDEATGSIKEGRKEAGESRVVKGATARLQRGPLELEPLAGTF